MLYIDNAKEPGAKIGAWNANGGPNQLWNFEPGTGGGAAPSYGQQQYPYSQQQTAYPQGGAGAHRLRIKITFAKNRVIVVQNAVLRLRVVRLSVCDVGGSGSHMLPILETN